MITITFGRTRRRSAAMTGSPSPPLQHTSGTFPHTTTTTNHGPQTAESIGGSLPPEIIQHIVSFLQPHENRGWQYSLHPTQCNFPTLIDAKPRLAECSLVCRHWASVLRKFLFSRIALPTRDDCLMLEAILDSPVARPGPQLSDCIETIVVTNVRQWGLTFHNLFRDLLARVDPAVVALLIIDLPTPTSPTGVEVRCYLPFFSLPSPLPWRLFPLTYALLADVTLQSQQDIARLLDNCPTVSELGLLRVSFLQERRIRRRGRPSSRLKIVHVHECGNGTVATQIALASAILASQKSGRIDVDGAWGSALELMLILQPPRFRDLRGIIYLNVDRSKSSVTAVKFYRKLTSSIIDPLDSPLFSNRAGCWKIDARDETGEIIARLEATFHKSATTENSHTDFTGASVIASVQIGLPAFPDVLQHLTRSTLDRFDQKIRDLPRVPGTWIAVPTSAMKWLLGAILDGALSGNILAGRLAVRQVEGQQDPIPFKFGPDTVFSDEIFDSPTTFTFNEKTITLTSAHRAEWLVRQSAFDKHLYLLERWCAAQQGGMELSEAERNYLAQTIRRVWPSL